MKARPSILVFTLRNDYTVTPVGTGAWVQLSASLPEDCDHLEVFDSSGSVLQIGYGPAGSELVLGDITPGGNTTGMDTILNKGIRLAIKAVDVAAATGQLVINAYL